MQSLSFFVSGIPVPKGSAHVAQLRDGRAILRQNKCKGYSAFTRSVRVEARAAMKQRAGGTPSGPVSVALAFFFPRPKGHYGTGKNAGQLRASAPAQHTVKPDLDKLARCVLDELSGIAFLDDAQVCRFPECEKRYVNSPDAVPGVRITVEWESNTNQAESTKAKTKELFA